MAFKAVIKHILFMDVKDFSKLEEELDLENFHEKVMAPIGEILTRHDSTFGNTWGDAVIATFDDAVDAASAALDIRDLFRKMTRRKTRISHKLAVRIVLNSGTIFEVEDPIRRQPSIAGKQITVAARIEPRTTPNQIWATNEFVVLLNQKQEETIVADPIGEHALAKKFGARELYRIRTNDEIADIPPVYQPGKRTKEADAILQLSNAAFADPSLKERLPNLANHLRRLFTDQPTFLALWADRRLNELVEYTSAAAEGSVYIDKGDEFVDYVMELLRVAEKNDKIFATSYIKTTAFWDSPAATAYLKEHERLIKEKNVTITRFFLFDEPDALDDPRNKQETKKHHDAGVHVYTGITKKLNKDLRRDMFLIENRIAVIFDLTIDREELLGLHIMVKQEEVRRMSVRMEALLERAEKYSNTAAAGA